MMQTMMSAHHSMSQVMLVKITRHFLRKGLTHSLQAPIPPFKKSKESTFWSVGRTIDLSIANPFQIRIHHGRMVTQQLQATLDMRVYSGIEIALTMSGKDDRASAENRTAPKYQGTSIGCSVLRGLFKWLIQERQSFFSLITW